MTKKEKTSEKLASHSSKVMRDPYATKTSKSLAGSALSQTRTDKKTSSKVATKASEVMNDKRSSKSSKSLAGSVLSQAGSFPVKMIPLYPPRGKCRGRLAETTVYICSINSTNCAQSS